MYGPRDDSIAWGITALTSQHSPHSIHLTASTSQQVWTTSALPGPMWRRGADHIVVKLMGRHLQCALLEIGSLQPLTSAAVLVAGSLPLNCCLTWCWTWGGCGRRELIDVCSCVMQHLDPLLQVRANT